MEPLMNRVMEIEIENPFEEFKETPRMSMMPRFPGNFLGHRDRDDDFDFGGLLDHLTNQVMSSQFSRSWSPFGQPEFGKLTVIKAGPGFHDEKHYDIGPNGKLTEVTETPIHKDWSMRTRWMCISTPTTWRSSTPRTNQLKLKSRPPKT